MTERKGEEKDRKRQESRSFTLSEALRESEIGCAFPALCVSFFSFFFTYRES